MIASEIVHLALEHWAAACLVGLAAWLLRNRLRNGLHRYPGPVAASLTDWWRLWDVYKQRPDVTHLKLHAEYGDVVRLGPNCLSFADPEALKTIYGLNKGFVKSDFYAVQQPLAQGRPQPSLFSTTDNAFHAQFRRCVSAAFSMSALVQYEPAVDNTTRLFLDQTERLFAQTGARCDFTQWLQFYAFDVIGEITYGTRHGFVERNADVDGIVDYLGRLFLYVAPVGQMPLLDKLLLKNPLYLLLAKLNLVDSTFPVARFAQARMKERLGVNYSSMPDLTQKFELDPSKPDLLSKFLAAQAARPEFMTDRLVGTMAVSMAFAGSETTAITLAAVFYHLLRTPAAMRRLREELDGLEERGAFGDVATGLVTWAEAQQMPYLDACIKEAFRIHPAAGLPLERIVPEGGADIAGHFVRGGTIVGCSAWVIHRRRDVFGVDADVYRPERWLDPLEGEAKADQEWRIKRMNATMIQFGMGSRTCIGKNISLLEVYKLVPSLLRRFDIEFEDPRAEWHLINAWFVKQTNFFAKFTRRPVG
jgi:cytochrome P450